VSINKSRFSDRKTIKKATFLKKRSYRVIYTAIYSSHLLVQSVRKSISTSMKAKKKNTNPTITAENTEAAVRGTERANTVEAIVPNMPKNIPPALHFIHFLIFERQSDLADKIITVNKNTIAVIRAVSAVTKVAVMMELAKSTPPTTPKIIPAINPAIVFIALPQHEHSFCTDDISSSTPFDFGVLFI